MPPRLRRPRPPPLLRRVTGLLLPLLLRPGDGRRRRPQSGAIAPANAESQSRKPSTTAAARRRESPAIAGPAAATPTALHSLLAASTRGFFFDGFFFFIIVIFGDIDDAVNRAYCSTRDGGARVSATMKPTQPAGRSFSAYGQGSFNQPLSGFSRTPATMSEAVSNSGSQARPPLPGVQTISILGSMGPGSQMRPGGASSLQQQRATQPPVLSQAQPASPSLSSQKFQNHGMLRGPTIGTPGSISSATSHGSQIPHPSWVSGQAKQIQTNSVPSSSIRPQVRPQSLINQSAQTPHLIHSVPTPSNQQLPPTPQQQQPHMRSQPSSEQYSQQCHTPRAPQGVSPQQQSIRAPILANQKSVTVNAQPGMLQVSHPTITSNERADDGTHILSKRSIHELVTQIYPSEKLDPEVEDILVDIAEDFVESITTFA